MLLTYTLNRGPGSEVRIILELVGICCRILEGEKKKGHTHTQTDTQTDKQTDG